MSLLAYVKRYAGGFADSPATSSPIDAQTLNNIETALLGLLGAAPTDGQAQVYDDALGRFKTILLTNAHIDPAAAIAKSKLAALNIADADIAAAAGIAASKLGGNIPASKLSGYPGVIQQFLRGDGTWVTAAQPLYRKTTTKQVLNTVAETDLLNGEITVAAGAMGINSALRITAECDWVNNSGATVAAIPRFKLKLGASTLIDSNAFAVGNLIQAGSNRYPFTVRALVQNLGATNSQLVQFSVDWQAHQAGSALAGYTVAYTTGTGFTTITPSAGANVPCAVSSKATNTSGVDMTLAQALVLSVINPTATATCDTTLRAALVELI